MLVLLFQTNIFIGDSGMMRKQIRHHIVCKLASVFYDKAMYMVVQNLFIKNDLLQFLHTNGSLVFSSLFRGNAHLHQQVCNFYAS